MTPHDKLSQEETDRVLRLYNDGIAIRQIVKMHNHSRNTIRNILKNNNIEIRKEITKINDSWLDNIDTDEKAYFLGWMWGGGCVNPRDNAFTFNKNIAEIETLKLFSNIFYYTDNKVKTYTNDGLKDGLYCSLSVFNKKLKYKLLELGYCDKIPATMANSLYRYFILGLLETNGRIDVYGDNKYILITASESVLKTISISIESLGIATSFEPNNTKNKSWSLSFSTYENVYKFLTWLYKDVATYSQSKYKDYQYFLQQYEKYITPKIYPHILERQKKVIQLHSTGMGSRKIAKILNVNRSTILSDYSDLGLNNLKRDNTFPTPTESKCTGPCQLVKPISEFRERKHKRTEKRKYFDSTCAECDRKLQNEKYKEYTDYLKANNLPLPNTWKNKNLSTNQLLRHKISSSVRSALKEHNSGKNGASCLDFIPYTMQELNEHLENLFEPWMNWGNWTKYNARTWDDNDPSTWAWNIDHIIPHSTFKYQSMEDEDFKKCWALSNLRPYSAKQNLLDGATKVRHKKK